MQQRAEVLRQNSYTRTYGAPSHDVWPRFHIEPVLDQLATERAGREIYRDEERVEINMPGNPYSKPVHVVTDEDRQRWPDEYERFKKGMDIAISGTPLEVWSILKPSMVRELKALDIMTVEQVAALNEHAIQRIPMIGRRLKDLAKVYLNDAERLSVVTQAQAREDRMAAENAELKLQIQNLQAQMQNFFAQHQAQMNAPHPIAAAIPSHADPIEAAKFARPQEAGQSSLDSLLDTLPKPRRGRPPKETQPDDETPPAAA